MTGAAEAARATLTLKEAAELLGVDPRTVSAALSTRGGAIPARQVGRRVVIPRGPFFAWLSGPAEVAEPAVVEQVAAPSAAGVIRARLVELLGVLEGIER